MQSLEFVESHAARAHLHHDTPEPELWLCSYVTCWWRKWEGSIAWGRTDGFCHTLQCRPERCAVKLQESIDEGQLLAWKPCKGKLPYYHAGVTDWVSDAAHMLACCIQNTVYILSIINAYVQGSSQAPPYINYGNHISQWVIWWDLCPTFD